MSDWTRRWIALLLVCVLPVQGVCAAIQRVAMPAHFHVQTFEHAETVLPRHADDVLAYLDDDTADVQLHAGIGRHEHAVDAVGVVYIDGDGDGSAGNSSTRNSIAFDMLLPHWSMPPPPELAPARLPTMTWVYASHRGERLDRPPR